LLFTDGVQTKFEKLKKSPFRKINCYLHKIVDSYPGRTMMLNGEDFDALALLENRTIANYRHLLEGIDLLASGS